MTIVDNSTQAQGQSSQNLPAKKPFFKEVFGQFVTGEFWKGVARTVAHEMVVAFFTALGGVLMWYGKKKQNQEIFSTVGGYGQPASQPSAFSTPSSPFSRPVTPYSPSYSQPHTPPATVVENFPGFGPSR